MVNSLSPIQHVAQLSSVAKLHAERIQDSNGWTNSFSVLDGNWRAPNIVRANGAYQQYRPNFTDVHSVYDSQNLNSTNCFDFYEVTPGVYVVDCSNKNTNQFYVTSNPYYNTSIPNNNTLETEVTTRILRGNTQESNTTLFRGTPHYALPRELSKNSSIEVFTLNSTNLTPVASGAILNATTLQSITQIKNLDFYLVDFYVHGNGSLSVLDRSGAIYQVELNTDGVF